MVINKKILLEIILIILSTLKAFSQVENQDNDFVQSSIRNAYDEYNEGRREKLPIYKGRLYQNYRYHIGHPFFMVNDFSSADILYEGIVYNGIPAKYDLVKEQLIILHFDNFSQLVLENEGIKGFSLHGHDFKYLYAEDSKLNINGFYEILYEGSIGCYKKNKKELKKADSKSSAGILQIEIAESSRYFLFKDGKYITFKGKPSLLRALKDKRKEIKKYLKDNKIRFKTDPDEAVKNIASYYSTFKSQGL